MSLIFSSIGSLFRFRTHHVLVVVLFFSYLFLELPTGVAGPYRTIHIDDQPLGNSLTHVFWLRTIEDNQERYDNPLIHQFLIKQNIETGTIENHWLLRRLKLEARYDPAQDGSKPAAVLNVYEPPLDLNEAKPISEPPDSSLYRDAFEILRSEQTAPIPSTSINWSHSELQSWKITNKEGLLFVDSELELNEDIGDQNDIRVDADELVKQIRMLLHPSIREMKKFMWSGDDPRSAIPLESLTIDLSLCSTGNQVDLHTTKSMKFMQLHCESEDLISWYKVWVRI